MAWIKATRVREDGTPTGTASLINSNWLVNIVPAPEDDPVGCYIVWHDNDRAQLGESAAELIEQIVAWEERFK